MSIQRGGKKLSVKLIKHQRPTQNSQSQTATPKHVAKNENNKYLFLQRDLAASENEFVGLDTDEIEKYSKQQGNVAVAYVES